MAIDTAAKRQSAFIDVSAVVIPDGSIDTADRITLIGQYGGLPITAQARVTEEFVEPIYTDPAAFPPDYARISEELVEAVYSDDSSTPVDSARVTEEFIEVAYGDQVLNAAAGITQEVVEVAYSDSLAVPADAVRLTQQSVEVLYLLETTTDPFNDCGVFTGVREWEARLYDAADPSTGVRKAYGPDMQDLDGLISTVNFEIQERGGYGGGSFEFLADWADSTLAGTERLDVWMWDDLRYRGYVKIAQKELAAVQSVRPQLYGMVAVLDQWKVRKKYAYGCQTDVVTIFRDIVLDYVAITGRFPSISIDNATPVGATLKEFDGRGKSVAQCFNELADMAPNQAIWGTEVDSGRPVPGDVIYMRPKPTTTSYVVAVGDNVQAFTYPVDTHDILNSLAPLTGGTVTQPNLAINGSFEEVKPASEDNGNLLLNWDFESSTLAEHWDSIGHDPTVKYSGHPTAHGNGRSGHQWAELDENGEGFTQTVAIIPETHYEASCWARLEDPTKANAGLLQLEGLNSVSAVVTTVSVTVEGLSAVYKRFAVDLDLSLYPTVTQLRITIRADGGTASDDGVLFDDCGIYEYCAVAQEQWRVTPTGAAVISEMDWASTAVTPRTGGYVAHMKCTSIALTADTGEIYYLPSQSPSVNPNERYTLVVFWHTNGAGTVGANALTIGAVSIDSSNNQGTVWESDTVVIPNPAPTTWQMAYFDFTTENTTARAQLFIRVRTNEHIYLDDVFFVQGEIPDEVKDNGGWWPDTTYQRYITVEDTEVAAYLDAGISDSITTYGEHEDKVDNSLVTDLTTAVAFASGQFNAKAVPKIEARLEIYGAKQFIAQDGKVRLVNLPNAPAALWPSRTTYTISAEAILCSVELGNQRPDLASLLTLTTERARKGLA